MTFELSLPSGPRAVSVEPVGAAMADGGDFRVVIDGVTYEISARRTDLGLSILHQKDQRSVDVAVTERTGGEYLLQLARATLAVAVDGRRRQRGGAGDAAAKGAQRLQAPMPGRVVRVLVKPGDAVTARQGLVVVEAMKMENELAAARDGHVKEVSVSEGQLVEAGRLLVVID
jgi:biotin carboxyl carrier protein